MGLCSDREKLQIDKRRLRSLTFKNCLFTFFKPWCHYFIYASLLYLYMRIAGKGVETRGNKKNKIHLSLDREVLPFSSKNAKEMNKISRQGLRFFGFLSRLTL